MSHIVGRVLWPTDSRVSVNVLPRYRWPTRRPRFKQTLPTRRPALRFVLNLTTVHQAHGSHRPVRARISAYGSSNHGFATCNGEQYAVGVMDNVVAMR